MKYIARVISNAKGGVAVELGPKTLIVGKNEAGKSAVVNAIELALTARASGIYGRDTAAEHDLLSLIAPAKEPLWSQAEFEDGARARFEFPKGKKTGQVSFFDAQGVQQPNLPWDPATVLPIRPLTAAIAGKTDTTRKFFLHFAVGELRDADVLKRIAPTLHGRLNQSMLGAPPDLVVVDKLLYALDSADKNQKRARAEAKASAAIIDKLGEGLPPSMPEAEFQALRQSVENGKAQVAQLQQYKGAIATALNGPQLAQQKETLKGYAQQNLQAAQAKMLELEAAARQLPPRPAQDGIPRKEMLTLLDWHVRENDGACNLCGAGPIPPGHFAARKKLAQERVQGRQATEENYTSLQGEWERAKAAVDQAATEIRNYDAEIAKLQADYATAQTQAVAVDAQLAAAQSQLQLLETNLQQARTATDLWNQHRKARDAGAEAEKEEAEWKQLVEAIKDAIKALLDDGAGRLQQWVQLRLPPGDHFMLQLRDKQKSVFRFGLERDGRLDVALSQGKWAHVMAAISDVCRDQNGFAVIIPEDRGFDPETLGAVLHSLGSCTAQVVITCTTRPAFVPDGWTIIDADKGEHRPRVGIAPTQQLQLQS